MRRHDLFAIFAGLVLVSCGGSTLQHTVTPLTTEDKILFDNGIDLVDNPTVSTDGGGWVGEFERRVRRADFVSDVRITSLNTDTGTDRRVTYRLAGVTSQPIKGHPPGDVTLRVLQGEPGYAGVRRNEDRLMKKPHVLFGKWERHEETGQSRIRWHLSPATGQVRAKAKAAVRVDAPPGNTTIEVIRE